MSLLVNHASPLIATATGGSPAQPSAAPDDHPWLLDLPRPVAGWLEVAWPQGIDPIETVVLGGPVRIRRGRLALPGETTMRFRLGHGYVNDIRIGMGRVTAVRGLDALVDGVGMTQVGKTATLGHEIDQGTFLALWCQSLLFPSAWTRLRGLRWTAVRDDEVIVTLPFSGGLESAVVRFDPSRSAFPVSFTAERYREVGRPKVGWRADYLDWHWRDGVAMPTTIRAQWADQPGPWFEMRVERAALDVPIEGDEDRARLRIGEALRAR